MSRRSNRNRRVTRRALNKLHADMGARAAKLLEKYDALEITRLRARIAYLEAMVEWLATPWYRKPFASIPKPPDLDAVVNEAMENLFPAMCEVKHESGVPCEGEADHEGEHFAHVLRRVTESGKPEPERIEWSEPETEESGAESPT